MGRFRHVLRADAFKGLQKAQKRIVLGKAVHEIQAGLAAADADDAVDDIEIEAGL